MVKKGKNKGGCERSKGGLGRKKGYFVQNEKNALKEKPRRLPAAGAGTGLTSKPGSGLLGAVTSSGKKG